MKLREQLATMYPTAIGAQQRIIAAGGAAVDLVAGADIPWTEARNALVMVAENDVLATFDDSPPARGADATGNGGLFEQGYIDVWSLEMVSACKIVGADAAKASRVRVEWLS